MTSPAPVPVRYSRLLRSREFRGLLLAQITSEAGDHFARVAVAALILDRSGSAFYAAMTFAVSYLPAIFGSALLAPLADRMPRKRLMLFCDAARVALVGLLAIVALPGTPLWVLFGLLLLAELFAAPFEAARAATLPDVLPGPDQYTAGSGLSKVLYQVNQVIGLTAAGVLAYVLSPRWALVIDAGTFVVSFAILTATLRARDAPLAGMQRVGGLLRDFAEGVALVFGDPCRRALVILGWGSAIFLIAAEGVALVYGRAHGSPDMGGMLMAAVPAGAGIGAWCIARQPVLRQVSAIRPLAFAACLPLLATGLDPPIWVAMALWFVSGACQAFMVPIIAVVNLLTPREFRGRVNGLAAAGFSVANAVAFLLAGLVADRAGPAAAVAIAGGAGLAGLAALGAIWPGRDLPQRLAATRGGGA
ncbi:MAG: MFS transporter [Streptomycetales bacterium]